LPNKKAPSAQGEGRLLSEAGKSYWRAAGVVASEAVMVEEIRLAALVLV